MRYITGSTLRGAGATLLALWFGAGSGALSPAAAAGFAETVLATNINSPVSMAIAPDGRIFVAQQGGQLRIIKDGAMLPTPFLTAPTIANDEEGLLSVAFHPNFPTTPYVYVVYTASTPTRHNRISRFTAAGDLAVPGSEVPLYDFDTNVAHYHVGGAIHFGPDGKLYSTTGDNANGINAQNLTTTFGKIVRLNPDGSIPADNPFVGQTTGIYQAIWARGFRNAFTFGFQPGTGRLFINDVGGSSWEEVNDGIAGSNYGWPFVEGPSPNPSYRPPVHAYPHSDGCAITGGVFYNPTVPAYPLGYVGKYFYAEYCRNEIRWIDPANPGTYTFFRTTSLPGPVDLRVGPDGNLYYLARGNSGSSGGDSTSFGEVVRITYTPPDSLEIVNWGGDYVPTDSNVRDYDTPIEFNVLLEPGFTGARWHVPFSDTAPLTPTASLNVGTSWRFYGGQLMHSFTNAFAFKWAEIWNRGANDQQYSGGPTGTKGWDLRYWQKADFLNGATAGAVTFNAQSRLEILNYQGGDGVPGNNSGRVRFVVRDGGQFFISEDFAGPAAAADADFVLTDPGNRRWAPYSPAAPHAISFNAAAATFTTRFFTNITAAGYLHSNDNVPAPAASAKAGFTCQRVRVVAHLSTVSGVGDPDGPPPVARQLELRAARPNPFRGATRIGYRLNTAARVAIEIFDLQGRRVAHWPERLEAAGEKDVTWRTEGRPAGVYFYQVRAGLERVTGKLNLLP